MIMMTQSVFKYQDVIIEELRQDLKKIQLINDVQVEARLNNLLDWLKLPPNKTTFRVNTLLTNSPKILTILATKNVQLSSVEPNLPELIIIGKKETSINSEPTHHHHQDEAVVDAACGAAVLRGSHIFAPGIMGLTGGKIGQKISLFADITGLSKQGFIKKYEAASKKYLGSGILRQTRDTIFQAGGTGSGLAIEVTETVSALPQLSESDLPDGHVLLQNFPSIICSRILDPQPGETVLDMCAAPGNKTTHLAALMKNQGTLVAMEKIKSKIPRLENNCRRFGCKNVRVFCFDGTRSVDGNERNVMVAVEDGPPFGGECFDRILLDGPCSVLGKRPLLLNKITSKELHSYVPLQRKLFSAAVELLKDGGTLVYSTCTITIAENEGIVAWALRTFPCLELNPARKQYEALGLEKFPVSLGYVVENLSAELAQSLLRFGPENDTVGFFIASFRKKKKFTQ